MPQMVYFKISRHFIQVSFISYIFKLIFESADFIINSVIVIAKNLQKVDYMCDFHLK